MFQSVISFDQNTVAFFQNHQSALGYDVFAAITFLGEWWVVLGLSFLLVILFSQKERYRNIVVLVMSVIPTEIVVFLLKLFFPRERPPFHTYSAFTKMSSFPSGHAAIAVSFYGMLLYVLLKNETRLKKRRLLKISGVLFIFSIGFSRIYLGVHYPSDVAAGFVVGSFFLSLAILIAEKKIFAKPSEQGPATPKQKKKKM
ncbi:MAG TPA: phosphatase PAP2 family protein [Candidatus Paceibacterota bacterium]|nr:phosphatase PAP2 family protein [Candidatus Paceibacterota bacterium]